jgi:hypothetical protein
MSRIIKKQVTRNHKKNHKSNGRNRKSMKGGKQSDKKIKIKEILRITHETPDSYNPKQYGHNLKDYYTKLLEIYNDVWTESTDIEKKQLERELTYERGRIAKFRHPGRTRLYHELITELRNLDNMKRDLGRKIMITDFMGSDLGEGITCVDYGFAKCNGCHGVVFDDWAKEQQGKSFSEMELPPYFPVYVPRKAADLSASTSSTKTQGSSALIELERSPGSDSDAPPIALSAGKSRRCRHSRCHRRRTIKRSRKVRRMLRN